MVGYGTKFPQKIHHRGSSLPSLKDSPQPIACGAGFQYLHKAEPNPNILVGAIVGGPDQFDNYKDERDNYLQAEPSTYINAPLVGTLLHLAATTGAPTDTFDS